MTWRGVLTALFVLFLGAHVAVSFLTRSGPETTPDKRTRRLQVYGQGPILWLALYFGAVHGVFSRQLVSPLYIGAGLLLGHVTFALSLFVTHRSLEDTKSLLFHAGRVWNFTMRSPATLSRYLGGAAAEELIYRASAQPLAYAALRGFTGEDTWSSVGAVAAVAALFVVVHREFFSNTWWQGFEFVGFALLLGVLYQATGSFILVTMIHAVRNVEIAYLEYLARVEELDGDEEAAVLEMEKKHMRVHLERT